MVAHVRVFTAPRTTSPLCTLTPHLKTLSRLKTQKPANAIRCRRSDLSPQHQHVLLDSLSLTEPSLSLVSAPERAHIVIATVSESAATATAKASSTTSSPSTTTAKATAAKPTTTTSSSTKSKRREASSTRRLLRLLRLRPRVW